MKILVTGVKGQLGYDCIKELEHRGYNDILGIDREELDITDEKEILDIINKIQENPQMYKVG